MSRLIAALALALVLIAGHAVTPVKASEAEAKKEYQKKTREVRKAGDPDGWLRLGTWIEGRKDISERTQERWLRYIRHQYGVAAKKKLKPNDVGGWLALAAKMERLLDSPSVSKSYLREAFKKNPEDERLAAALGRHEGGLRDVASISWKGRKDAAEKAGTARAFSNLATWCRAQIKDNKQAEDWYTYCVARELYLSNRGGSRLDPIQKALDEGERKKNAKLRKPGEPRTPLPQHLGKRTSKGLKSEDFKDRSAYRLESNGRVTYSDSLPSGNGYDSVWKRGSRTTYTAISQTQYLMQESPAWWLLKWDSEARSWVDYTRAEHRAAEVKQLETARQRLRKAVDQLARVEKKLVRLPEDLKRARESAELIARKGGKVRAFKSALQSIVSKAWSHNWERTKKIEAEQSIAAWKAKIAELERKAR